MSQCMMITIRSSSRAYLSPSILTSIDKYLHSAANILVLNPATAPAIELKQGYLTLDLRERVVFSVAGEATVAADGQRYEAWRAGAAERSISASTDGVAYLAIRGLVSQADTIQHLKQGAVLSAVNSNSIPDKLLTALKIPQGLRAPSGDWLESVSRLQRHITLVYDAIQRGAELVRVRVSGGEFEAWVLELE
ncbi:MAG: hypothetical protein LM590_02985 [Thermofilum sp.]|nr:hypothetical protein [Thermofilum sp.]